MTPLDRYGALVTLVDRPTQPGPLAGLRVGVKDLIAVAGVPRLCGAPAVADPTPQPRDATAVARLAAAGAHIVATTATHPFGWGVTTPGTTNPRTPDRTAGGSSGGSAAALAAGLVDGALGTDTAGSVRIPAACCGVAGLKTSQGLVPRDGVQPLAPSLDTVGPMARDVTTLARLLTALTEHDVVPSVPQRLGVGLLREVEAAPIDGEVLAAYEAAVERLRQAGAAVVRVSLPAWEPVSEATMTVLAAEEYTVHEATLRDHAAALSPGVIAALQTSAALPNDEVLAARHTVALFRHAVKSMFDRVDVVVTPALPCRVPRSGEMSVDVDGRSERVGRALIRLNAAWSAAGVTAGVVPVARDSDGAPIGVQIVGSWRAEATVLGVMELVERLSGGPWPPIAGRTED